MDKDIRIFVMVYPLILLLDIDTMISARQRTYDVVSRKRRIRVITSVQVMTTTI